MSPVFTLRNCLVAGGAALALVVTVGAGIVTAYDAPDAPAAAGNGGRIHLDLPAHPEDPDVLPDLADLAAQVRGAQPAAPTTVTAPAPAPRTVTVHAAPSTVTVPAPAPAPAPVQELAPAPLEPTCATGEAWDGERCVAQQLPEESVGGARCDDPAQVVVAILEDGTPVCGPADDTVAGA